MCKPRIILFPNTWYSMTQERPHLFIYGGGIVFIFPSNNGLPTYPRLGYLAKQPHFLDTWPNKHLTPSTKWQSCGRHHEVYLTRTPMTTQPHKKIAYDDIKEVFRAKEWNSFPSLGEETRLPPPQGFSQMQMWIVLEVTTTMQDHCYLLYSKP